MSVISKHQHTVSPDTHTHTHTKTCTHSPSPHRPLPLRYALPTLSPPVARQHVPCADTHLPSGFSALNLVLIANWVGEQADAGWMRSRQPRLRLWPRTRLSRHEVTETVGWETKAHLQEWKCRNMRQSLGSQSFISWFCNTWIEIRRSLHLKNRG